MSQVTGYSRLQIALHWVIVALLIMNYLTSDAMKSAWHGVHEGKDFYGTTAALHVWVGITILVLAVLRLIVRVTRGAPEVPTGTPNLFRMAAKAAHLALYLLLFAIPAAGIAAWFGRIDAAGGAHELMFNLLMVVVSAHVAGAVYHQVVLKDHLIGRMMKAD